MLNSVILSIVFISLALVLYIGAAILLFLKKEKFGKALLYLGWGFNTALIALNWIVSKHPPMANIYQVMGVLGFSFVPLYLLLKFKDKIQWVAPYFATAAAVPMVGALVLIEKSGSAWGLMPALQSIWFVPHVFSYMLAYAMAAVAFVLTVVALFDKGSDMQKQFDNAIYCVMRICLAFTTFGLFLGAIWAEEAWGNYWSWDIKETWSLITWILYLLYFHCRTRKKLQKYARTFVIIAFASLLVTFLLVNYFPQMASGLHSYGA